MNRIKELISKQKTVWVKFPDRRSCYHFLLAAGNAGFYFTDGSNPADSAASDMLVVHPDGHLTYPGWAGYVKYHSIRNMVSTVIYSM